MIDFHCHILPAVDDGAVSIDESISMARSLSAFGYKTVCCTPHCIKGSYDITPQKVREATLMLQADLDNADVQLELWPGMEYMLDEHFSDYVDDLLTLGGTKLVLCQAPPRAHTDYILEGLRLIVEKGFVPFIAHPERSQYFYETLTERETWNRERDESKDQKTRDVKSRDEECQQRSRRFFKKFWPFAPKSSRSVSQESLMSASRGPRPAFPEGCHFHANLGSFTGFYGSQVQARAYEILKNSAYTGIASDLHNSASVVPVLQRDKLALNPLLKKLSDFNGFVSRINSTDDFTTAEQIGLF